MEEIVFGESQGLACVTCIPLSERVVPAFHVVGQPGFFANRMVCLLWKDIGIGFPKVTIGLAMLVSFWDGFPQQATGRFTAIANHKGHKLPGATTHGGPQPAFVCLSEHKRPDFVQFKLIIRLSCCQSISQSRVALIFFSTSSPAFGC